MSIPVRNLLLFIFLFAGVNLNKSYSQHSLFEYPANEFTSAILDSFITYIDPSAGNLLQLDSFTLSDLKHIPKKVLDTLELEQAPWARISIWNMETSINQNYLGFKTRSIDSVHVYRWSGSGLQYLTNLNMHTRARDHYLFSHKQVQPLSLLPGQENVFFFQLFETKNDRFNNFKFHATLYKDKYLVNSMLNSRGMTFLSEGILIIFALISFFLAFSFRTWDFFYFALFVLFSACLIVGDVGIISGYFYPLDKDFILGIDDGALGMFFFGGMVLSATLFISAFLQLNQHMPKFRKFYIGISILFLVSCIFAYLISITNPNTRFYRFFSLILFLFFLWVPINLIPIIQGVIKKRTSAVILLIALILLVFSSLIISASNLSGSLNPYVSNILKFFLPFFGTLMYGLITRVNKIQKERLNFRIEKEKSEALLFNILPEEVATELKEKGESQAKMIDEVTVLFSDFVGFTEKSSKLSPDELVDELNACFKAFDQIMESHNIEKIKTIGDAYMAAGGLYSADTILSSKQVVLAALKMQEFMTTRKAANEKAGKAFFEMRLGIHTGPIVAGVVGVKKFQYDIWGDTVNTASRIETNGHVGKVNASEATYELLKDDPDLSFESRGKIKAKGKGEIEMYFVSKV